MDQVPWGWRRNRPAAVVSGVRNSAAISNKTAISLKSHLAPRRVSILRVVPDHPAEGVRVVDAQHSGEGGVDEPASLAFFDRRELEDALRGARVHDALHDVGVAAD